MRIIFIAIAALLSCSAIATGQTIEDFKCTVPTSVTAANPAVVTFAASDCGYNMRAMAWLIFTAAPSNGDTVTLGSTVYTFVTSINNATPRQVLIGLNQFDSAYNFYMCAADKGFQKGTLYSSATSGADPNFEAITNFQSGRVWIGWRTAGAAGIGQSLVSSHTAVMSFDSASTRMESWVKIVGGTGCWAGTIGGGCGAPSSIGTFQTPKFFYIRWLTANSYQLYITETATWNASVNGSNCTGSCASALYIQPAGPDTNYYPKAALGNSWSSIGYTGSDAYYHFILPGCTNTAHEMECAEANDVPEQTVSTARVTATNLSSFTVTSGVGTIVLASAFPFTSNSNANLTPGAILDLRNFTDTAGAWTHTITAPNDSTTGTVAGHLVKYVPGANTVRSPIYQDPGGSGGVIGVCQSGCGPSGTATIADNGLISCVFDNNYTAGDWVTPTGYDDRCHDAGVNYLQTAQPLGIVQSNGSAGTAANVWWNGLNRRYVVQSTNESCTPTSNPVGPGNCAGTGVTILTINLPGYPDGNYLSFTQLTGITQFGGLGGSTLIGTNVPIQPYIIYAGSWSNGYQQPVFQGLMKNQAGFNGATTNRISFWINWGKNNQICNSNTAPVSLGTYYTALGEPNEQGQHRYIEADPELYSGWMRYDMNLAPVHDNNVGSQDVSYDYPADASFQGSALGWRGKSHYIDRFTTFYQDLSGLFCLAPRNTSGQTILSSPVTLGSVAGEPEELVRGRFGQWAPHLFQGGDAPYTPTGSPGYSISWAVPHNGVISNYEIRYSTTGSIHASGFGSALCQNGTTTCNSSDQKASDGIVNSLLYHSASMSQQQNIWFAIKPISTNLFSTSGNLQNPTWLITQVDSGYQVGDHITVAGVTGNTNANVSNTAISAVQSRQVWNVYDPTPNTQLITAYPVNTGSLVKITVANHGVLTGQTIQIFSATGTGLNGVWGVTAVDGSTLTLTGSSYDTTCPCSGGKIRLSLPGNMSGITSNGVASPNTTCTVTTTAPHNLVPGWMIDIVGAPDSHLSNSNGLAQSTYTVTNVGSSTSFDFVCPANTPINTTFNTDGPGVTNEPFTIISWPALAIPVAGNGAYTNVSPTATISPASTADGPFGEIFIPASGPAPSSPTTTGTLLQGVSQGITIH